MIKIHFENCESIAGAEDNIIIWVDMNDKIKGLQIIKPNELDYYFRCYDDISAKERLLKFDDIVCVEFDGDTSYVDFNGEEINSLQSTKYIDNQIIITFN